jgi:hypothetical protein
VPEVGSGVREHLNHRFESGRVILRSRRSLLIDVFAGATALGL